MVPARSFRHDLLLASGIMPQLRRKSTYPNRSVFPSHLSPPSSASVMCVIAILTEAERKRQDRSIHRAEERRRRARMMRFRGPPCPHSSVLTHASAAQGPKRLISKRNQSNLPSSGKPLGECRGRCVNGRVKVSQRAVRKAYIHGGADAGDAPRPCVFWQAEFCKRSFRNCTITAAVTSGASSAVAAHRLSMVRSTRTSPGRDRFGIAVKSRGRT
jgi:hypothetical protein